MLAFLVPLILSSVRGRLPIPIVVGEIVTGMIVSRSRKKAKLRAHCGIDLP
jgi:hypothetical protein